MQAAAPAFSAALHCAVDVLVCVYLFGFDNSWAASLSSGQFVESLVNAVMLHDVMAVIL